MKLIRLKPALIVTRRMPQLGRGRSIQLVADNGLLVMIVLVGALFAVLSPHFLTASNLIAVVATVAVVGIMAVMSTGTLISGGVDLSVGSNVALSGLLGATALIDLGPRYWWVAILVAVLVGTAIGIANGLLVIWLPVLPFIITFGTLEIVRGLAFVIGSEHQESIPGPAELLFIGQGKVGPVPFQAVLFIIVAAVILTIERKSVFGRRVFAVGANPVAARLAGLPVKSTKFFTYVISGFGAGLAGIVSAVQVQAAAAYYGQGLELDVLTAILLGGTSIFGGEGSAYRSVVGALLVGEIADGLGILNVNSDMQVVVKGLLLIAAVLLDRSVRARLTRLAVREAQ